MSGGGAAPAAFLDRDGTVIEERDYLSDPAQIRLLPGAVAAVRSLRAAGYIPVIVTNQSGIARGYYDTAAYQSVEAALGSLLESQGAPVAASYHCPHHPEFTGPCACRKPALGLFRTAERDLGIDLARSVYVGDRLRDVVPALELGGLGILVRTGYGSAEAADAPAEIRVVEGIEEAARVAVRWSPGR